MTKYFSNVLHMLANEVPSYFERLRSYLNIHFEVSKIIFNLMIDFFKWLNSSVQSVLLKIKPLKFVYICRHKILKS